VTAPAQLKGARVSVGAPDSGVSFTVRRLLTAIGLSPERDLRAVYLGVDASVTALQRGEIDAFFWIGALPTPSVTALASSFPIRLLDLEAVANQVRATYKEYAEGTVPAGTYSITAPITTLLVRNFLLVGAGMADDLAYALVDGMFRYQPQLARATEAALTIDLRAAIGTQPVPLHPGAERYFRAAKNT
jgi:TRAP transporter TAXI family solute receptor